MASISHLWMLHCPLLLGLGNKFIPPSLSLSLSSGVYPSLSAFLVAHESLFVLVRLCFAQCFVFSKGN